MLNPIGTAAPRERRAESGERESAGERGLQCKAGLTFFIGRNPAFPKNKKNYNFITIASKALEVLFL